MGAVEGVVGGGGHQRPEVLRDAAVGVGLGHSGEELVLHLGHQVALLLPHRLAQVVGLGRAEPGHLLGDLHQLLLVDAAPVGGLGDRAQAGVRVADRGGVALAAGVVVDEAHRAGPVQRHQGDDVVEVGRAHAAERVAHPVGLELEDPDRVAAREHLERLRIVERDPLDVDLVPPRSLDDLDRVLDHVEVAQAQEVHLQRPISSIGPMEYWVTIL